MDLDWIVRPGYTSGRYILERNHENQPVTLKTMKTDLEPRKIMKTDLEP